jgi:hypothetical protein
VAAKVAFPTKYTIQIVAKNSLKCKYSGMNTLINMNRYLGDGKRGAGRQVRIK